MKIFQIGFNRCGTTSLWAHFSAHGLKSIHWDHGKLPLAIQRNLDAGEYIIKGYEDYEFFSDMMYLSPDTYIEACTYHKEFYAQVPDAYFILNTRDKDRWLRSRVEFQNLAKNFAKIHGYTSNDQVLEHWSADWDRHHADVRRDIPEDRLIVFNIETDPITDLDHFFGLEPLKENDKRLTHVNFTPGVLGKAIMSLTPRRLRRLFPETVRQRVSRLLRKRR